MSILYIVFAIIVAIVITSVIFVIIGKVEHKHRHLNINWLVMMTAIILACTLAMVLIYHNQHDITSEDVQSAYEQGVEDGKTSEHHDYPSNEEVENWFSKTEKVIVGTNGEDSAVHIIDGQGEEWVLYVDETINK